jgi:hypothetical protein
MGLLDSFKKIFGLDSKPHVLTHEQRVIENAAVSVEPVVVKPKRGTHITTLALHNKDSLGKLNKQQIAEAASKELGIEINTKLKKDEMIEAYLTAQKG